MPTAPQITYLPAAPPRRELFYDQHLHIGGRYPVSARFGAGGEVYSPGISFSDYGGMHTENHKLGTFRKLERPKWAVDDALLQKLLVCYIEERAMVASTGTPVERLAKAQKVITAKQRAKIGVLDRLCKEYVALKQQATLCGEEAKRLTFLSAQIETYDTCLRIDVNVAPTILGCVYHYYRCGLSSVATATALGIKPPHVRQILWKLSRTWERMQAGRVVTCRVSIDIEQALELRLQGMEYKEIAKRLGVSGAAVWHKLHEPRPLDPALAARFLTEGRGWLFVMTYFGHDCRNNIRHAIARAGLTIPPVKAKRQSKLAQPARKLREAGLTYKAIAKRLGCSEMGAYYALHGRRRDVPSTASRATPTVLSQSFSAPDTTRATGTPVCSL